MVVDLRGDAHVVLQDCFFGASATVQPEERADAGGRLTCCRVISQVILIQYTTPPLQRQDIEGVLTELFIVAAGDSLSVHVLGVRVQDLKGLACGVSGPDLSHSQPRNLQGCWSQLCLDQFRNKTLQKITIRDGLHAGFPMSTTSALHSCSCSCSLRLVRPPTRMTTNQHQG